MIGSSAAQPQQKCQKEGQGPDLEEEVEVLRDTVRQAQEKKKPTFRDFKEDTPPPNIIASHLSQYTLQNIVVGKYVELWYFTKDGCFKVMKQAHSQADDAFRPLMFSPSAQ